MRLIVRRVKPTPGSQLALFASYSYHGFITDRDGETLELEADHRRNAEVENAIRDLKYGVGLNPMPSGCFAAQAAGPPDFGENRLRLTMAAVAQRSYGNSDTVNQALEAGWKLDVCSVRFQGMPRRG